jgi:hypothetical protein
MIRGAALERPATECGAVIVVRVEAIYTPKSGEASRLSFVAAFIRPWPPAANRLPESFEDEVSFVGVLPAPIGELYPRHLRHGLALGDQPICFVKLGVWRPTTAQWKLRTDQTLEVAPEGVQAGLDQRLERGVMPERIRERCREVGESLMRLARQTGLACFPLRVVPLASCGLQPGSGVGLFRLFHVRLSLMAVIGNANLLRKTCQLQPRSRARPWTLRGAHLPAWHALCTGPTLAGTSHGR